MFGIFSSRSTLIVSLQLPDAVQLLGSNEHAVVFILQFSVINVF